MPGVCDSTYLDNSACAASAAVEAVDFATSLGGAIVKRCKEEVSGGAIWIYVSSLGDKAEFSGDVLH